MHGRQRGRRRTSNASEKKANDVFRVLKIFCESVSKKPLARFGRFVAVDALALLTVSTIILSSSCRESWRVYLAAAFSLCVNYYYASNQQSSSCVVSD